MRILIIALLLFPLCSVAQKTEVYLRLYDARGQQIKGEAFLKGFENCLAATSLNSSGNNNTQLNFTMTISGASAELKKAMANGELLSNGLVSVLVPNPNNLLGGPLTSYTIKLERISVTSCSETMGCNNAMNTTVSLQATRIGWTYYTGGTKSVSRKFGWDADANKEWTSF